MTNEANVQKRLILDTLIADGIIFVLLCIFFFFDLARVPLGFLLGAVISIVNHLILCLQANVMMSQKLSVGSVPATMACYFTRFILYGAGLFLGLYLDHIGVPYVAWYMTFIGYMVIKAIILIRYGNVRKKGKALMKQESVPAAKEEMK